MKNIKVEENSIITLENGVELLLLKKVGEVFIASNYSNLCDKSRYIIEQVVKDDNDIFINIVHRLNQDIESSKQLEEILKHKRKDEKPVEVSQISSKEEIVVQDMRNVLEKKDLAYTFNNELFPCFTIHIKAENIELTMTIEYSEGHIMYRIPFPVDVREEFKLLVSLYICNYNRKNPFKWNLDFAKGLLSMRYTYDIDEPKYFEEYVFGKFIGEMFESMLDQYTNLKDICEGNISDRRRDSYTEILRRTLSILVNDMKEQKSNKPKTDDTEDIPNPMRAVKLMTGIGDDVIEDTSIDEKKFWDQTDKFIDQIASGERIPTFEEFMKMREDIKKGKEKKIKNHPNILPFEDAI